MMSTRKDRATVGTPSFEGIIDRGENGEFRKGGAGHGDIPKRALIRCDIGAGRNYLIRSSADLAQSWPLVHPLGYDSRVGTFCIASYRMKRPLRPGMCQPYPHP